jgi:hypothetical protein
VTRRLSILSLALLALAGCGGSGATTDSSAPVTEPAMTTSGTASAPAGDPKDISADLCSTMRETIGSLPTPKKGEADALEDNILAAQQAYLDGMSELPIEPSQKDTLEKLLIAQQEVFDAGAAARSSEDPEAAGGEGGPAADATLEVGKLSQELGVTDCAGV